MYIHITIHVYTYIYIYIYKYSYSLKLYTSSKVKYLKSFGDKARLSLGVSGYIDVYSLSLGYIYIYIYIYIWVNPVSRIYSIIALFLLATSQAYVKQHACSRGNSYRSEQFNGAPTKLSTVDVE